MTQRGSLSGPGIHFTLLDGILRCHDDVGDTFLVAGSAGESLLYTDGQVFSPAVSAIFTNPAFTSVVRNAANDFSVQYTGESGTARHFQISFPNNFRTTSGKGVKITSVDVIYKVTTAALTALAATLKSRGFADNVANAMTAIAVTGTLSTATQANPYLKSLTVDTPAFMNTANTEINLELAVTLAATGVFDLFGFVWHYTEQN